MNTPPPLTPPAAPDRPEPPDDAPSLPQLPTRPGIRDLFEALLRRPAELARHDAAGGSAALRNFAMIALASVLVFGFVLGTFAWKEQLWAAPLKLGGGLLFAGLICYPSLYIFSCLAGSRASATRLAAILGGMLALAGLLLLGFAPAVWIFTQGTRSFGFMGSLAIGSWLVALFFGFRFVRTSLREHGATQRGPLTIWSVIFLLVTLQLTTSLRPILGRSDRFMTDEKKFFLEHWSETFARSLPDPKPVTVQVEEPNPAPSGR